jgi:Fe-S oxidoreductase
MDNELQYRTALAEQIVNNVSKCVRCRFCFSKCPIYESSDGWLTQGASGITQSLFYGIKLNIIDTNLRDILNRCTTCRSCELICERLMANVPLVDSIVKGRQLLLESGINPAASQQKALESLQKFGNPYGIHPNKRTAWAKSLNAEHFNKLNTTNRNLYYVGCTGAFNDRAQNVSKSIASVLFAAGETFGILEKEKCSGEPARVMGERELFLVLAEQNLEAFESLKIENVTTVSPHDYHCFVSEYPNRIDRVKVQHYTQKFKELIMRKTLTFQYKGDIKVAFHDPCYLSKYHHIHEEPRFVLESIPGLQLVEMRRNRENSLCCGGGGGRMWIDIEEEKRLSEIRVAEALSVGAQIIATACPDCLIHLEDAIKVLNLESKICVRDISEIVWSRLEGNAETNL